MTIRINMTNSKIGGNVSIGNGNVMPNRIDDVELNFDNNEFMKNINLLNDNVILEAIDKAHALLVGDQEGEELDSLDSIKFQKQTNGTTLKNLVLQHVSSFTTGVLASVLANMITH